MVDDSDIATPAIPVSVRSVAVVPGLVFRDTFSTTEVAVLETTVTETGALNVKSEPTSDVGRLLPVRLNCSPV